MSVIWTKKAGLITLPELSNPGTSEDLAEGKELIDEAGRIVVGKAKESSKIETMPFKIGANNVSGAIKHICFCKIEDGEATAISLSNTSDITAGKTITNNLLVGSVLYIRYGNENSLSATSEAVENMYTTYGTNDNYKVLRVKKQSVLEITCK